MLSKQLQPFNNKIYFFILSFLLFSVIIFNVFHLQVVKGSEYYFKSNNFDTQSGVIRSSRGLIFDRNGVKLVDNELKYNLYILKEEQRANYQENLQKTFENLSSLFQENVQEKYKALQERYKGYNVSEIKIYSKIEYNPYIFQIEANPSKYPYLRIEKTNVRKYLFPELTSHILGYTGEITEEDYRTGKFDFGDEIGKFGIEKGYDDILRGRNGKERIDIYFNENKRSVTTVVDKMNGNDIYLTIDINAQKKLYELTEAAFKRDDFKTTISSASVVQNVENGEILAMVSYPTFNSNLFVNGISQTDYNTYINNPGKPLSNKAIQYSQAPGSIIKTLTSSVALENGAISKNTIFSTGGTFEYGGVMFQDVNKRNFGDINPVQALCVSSNIFHMKAALELDRITNGKAAQTIAESFHKIGLDQPSGLKLGSESIGYYPVPEDKVKKNEPWLQGYLLNASIGQGEVRLTPLGAANLAATVANNGSIFKQQIVKGLQAPQSSSLGISSTNLATVREGMNCAAARDNSITQYDAKKYIDISVKTGTAETGQVQNGVDVIHGWEISYAPSSKPTIATAIFLENGQHGYHAGYISREFYKYWSTVQ